MDGMNGLALAEWGIPRAERLSSELAEESEGLTAADDREAGKSSRRIVEGAERAILVSLVAPWLICHNPPIISFLKLVFVSASAFYSQGNQQ